MDGWMDGQNGWSATMSHCCFKNLRTHFGTCHCSAGSASIKESQVDVKNHAKEGKEKDFKITFGEKSSGESKKS